MTATRLAFLKPGLLALALSVGAMWAVAVAEAQSVGAPGAVPVPAAQPTQASKPSVSTGTPIHAAPVRTAPPARAEVKPTWAELTWSRAAHPAYGGEPLVAPPMGLRLREASMRGYSVELQERTAS